MGSCNRTIGVPLWILFAACMWGQQYSIVTIAGNAGNPGFSGDSGSANGAQLNSPLSIAVDRSGNLYIGDSTNNRVRMVSNGTITTVAGNGTAGYKGDKGSATTAQLNAPAGVAVDSSGNLYIADTGNNVIRKVAGGTITTFAGNNTAGFAGDGGAAASAELNSPSAVAVDAAGNVYIADAGNDVIREVSGGNISTIVSGLMHPQGLAVDASGNLYIADTDRRAVGKFSGGVYTTIAGSGSGGFAGDDGPGTNAKLNDPTGIAVDSSGSIYIADTFNSRIRKLTPTGIITTIAGNGSLNYVGEGGPATKAGLYFPHGVAVDGSGNVFVADTSNSLVRKLQPSYPIVADSGVGNAASFAAQVSPGALATVFGTNFAPASAAGKPPLPISLAGVSVLVNGKTAPILYVTPAQVNFQVPWDTALGSAAIMVSVNGGTSNAVTVPVLAAAPGLFSSTSGHAVAQNADFTLNGPANPAKVGSTIITYLSGSGPVDPPLANGVAAPLDALVSAILPSSASIGSTAASVRFAGLAPGFVGLVQVNIVVPSGLTTGPYPLTVTIGSETSNSATIDVTQ